MIVANSVVHVASMMLIVHTFLILMNWTTIEFVPLFLDNIMKNHSFKHNWCLVMGNNPWLWLIPISGTVNPVEGLDYKGTIEVNRPTELCHVDKDQSANEKTAKNEPKLSYGSDSDDCEEDKCLLA